MLTLSTTAWVTALFVPSVTASIAPPFTSAVGITVEPVNVTLPFARVIKSVSSACPISDPSIFIVLSIRTGEPEAGLIFIAPNEVVMLTAASPWDISSDLIEDADIPVKFDPSPEKVVAANVPETVRVPFARFIRSVSSTCPT